METAKITMGFSVINSGCYDCTVFMILGISSPGESLSYDTLSVWFYAFASIISLFILFNEDISSAKQNEFKSPYSFVSDNSDFLGL